MLTITITPQVSDPRASQFGCVVELLNNGSETVELISFQTRIPTGVDVQNIEDHSTAIRQGEYKRLGVELTHLTDDMLILHSEQYRKQQVEVYKKMLNEVMKTSQFLKFYYHFFKGRLEDYRKTLEESRRAWQFRINTSEEAEKILENNLKSIPADQSFLNLFQTKLEFMKSLENRLGASVNILATIEGGSAYRRNYIFNCQRGALNPVVYNIGFDCIFSKPGEGGKQQTVAAGTSFSISPKPLTLTAIAIMAAIGGVIIRISLPHLTGVSNLGVSEFWSAIGTGIIGPQGLVAILSALIFFNIYEYTELGKSLTSSVGWRSAILIGSLSGLLNDRILAAITGILTGQPLR